MASSSPGPTERANADAPRAGGLALLGAVASVHAETTSLELQWQIEAPPRSVLAFIPRLKDSDGNLLLDSIFPSRGTERPYQMIWPLVDDIAMGLHLKPGQSLRQTFLLARRLQLTPARCLCDHSHRRGRAPRDAHGPARLQALIPLPSGELL